MNYDEVAGISQKAALNVFVTVHNTAHATRVTAVHTQYGVARSTLDVIHTV